MLHACCPSMLRRGHTSMFLTYAQAFLLYTYLSVFLAWRLRVISEGLFVIACAYMVLQSKEGILA